MNGQQLSEAQANAIVDRATKNEWDTSFVSKPITRSWLVQQVQVAPFDPDATTLLEYVQHRMHVADQLHRTLQEQESQKASSSQAASTQNSTTQATNSYNASSSSGTGSNGMGNSSLDAPAYSFEPDDDLDMDGENVNDDEPYQFGLDDFLDPSASAPTEDFSFLDRSPSPLPAPAPVSAISPSSNNTYPFLNGSSASAMPQYSRQDTKPTQDSTFMDPSLLSLNPAQSTNFINPSATSLQKPRSGLSVEVLVPSGRRSRSPQPESSSSKRVRLDTSEPSSSRGSSSKTFSGQPASVLKDTGFKPPSASQQTWAEIEGDIERLMKGANKAPISTVQKMMRLLTPFVTEPADATKTGKREATVTDLVVPPRGRLIILERIKSNTLADFDECFVTDPRATVLLAEWAKDLAVFAKGKGKVEGDEADLLRTAQPLMEAFKKLPISLAILRTHKGIGRYVMIISKSDRFDESTKDIAGVLVNRWAKQSAEHAARHGHRMPDSVTPAALPKKRPETNQDKLTEEARKKRKLSPPDVKPKVTPALKVTPAPPKQAGTSRAPSVSTTKPSAAKAAIIPAATVPIGKALPAFARRKPMPAAKPAPSKPAAPTPAPAPAAFDPFAMSLQDMSKTSASASAGGMSVGDTLNMVNNAMSDANKASVPRAGKVGKPRKTVRWEPEETIRKIKIVPILVYGDEYGNEISTSDYFNTTGEALGEGEGAAMKHLVEEIDWEEPPLVELNLSEDTLASMAVYPSRELMGDSKPDAEIQAEREKDILAVTYFDEADQPPHPTEPAHLLAESAQPRNDDNVTKMKLGYQLSNDPTVQLAIAAIHGGALVGLMPQAPLSAAPAANLQNLYPPPATGPTTTFSPPQAGGPAGGTSGPDLNALLAKLAVPNGALAPSLPMAGLQQPAPAPSYGYVNQPVPPPLNGYQSAPPVQPAFNTWQPPPPVPQQTQSSVTGQSFDWRNLGSIPADAYKRKKGGRRL